MAVGRRGEKWYAAVRIDGQQRWLGTFKTRAEAKAAVADATHQANVGNYVHPTKQTVEEFIDEWLPGFKPSVSPDHWYVCEVMLRCYVKPHIGHVKLSKLTHLHLNRLYATLMESGLSPTTVSNTHRIVRRLLRDAPLAINPASKASPPRPRKKDMGVWAPGTLREFLSRAEGCEDYVAYLLLAMTGMRRGEMLRLQWKDIDLDRATVTLCTSKNGRGRVLSLDPWTVSELRKSHKGQGPVHPTETGSAFSKRFTRTIVRWGFPKITVHDLRHTHATLLLQEKVHPKVVQERLGHSSIAVTMDIYSHVLAGMDEDAASVFASSLLASAANQSSDSHLVEL